MAARMIVDAEPTRRLIAQRRAAGFALTPSPTRRLTPPIPSHLRARYLLPSIWLLTPSAIVPALAYLAPTIGTAAIAAAKTPTAHPTTHAAALPTAAAAARSDCGLLASATTRSGPA